MKRKMLMKPRKFSTPITLLIIVASLLLINCLSCSPRSSKPWTREDETKKAHDARMQWFRDARFGMFIHWGLYAVPAGIWNGKDAGRNGEWIMDHAKIPVDQYKPLAQQFNPTKFDARQWVSIAKNAGMKYIVITSKHHDGFSLFDSKLTDYDIVDATPFKRDPLKELALACREQGIKFCFYHSIMDWYRPEQKTDFPKYKKFLYGQLGELLTNYGPLGILWFDGEWIPQWDRAQGRELEQFVHSFQPDIIINNRVGKRERDDGDYGTPEQFIPNTGIPGHDWEACMTMNDTWGFKKNDHHWKSKEDLIHKLIDITSKGGNFLLNVGPTAEGLIPAPSVERLAAMGKWMKTNGESIYGTTASPFRYLPWGRCTRKADKLYLHVFDWPKDARLVVPGLLSTPTSAYLLADPSHRKLPIKRQADNIVIGLPKTPPDLIASVVVLCLKGSPQVDNTIRPLSDGSLELWARDAQTHGSKVCYHVGHGTSLSDYISDWSDKNDWISWEFKLDKPGTFAVSVTAACAKGSGGSEYVLSTAGQNLSAKTKGIKSWNKFKTVNIGNVKFSKPGRYQLTIKPKTIAKDNLMNFKTVKLTPQP